MDYENYVYGAATTRRFEDFRNAAVNLKRNILSDNRRKSIYMPKSIYLRIIEPKSIPMQCGWLELKFSAYIVAPGVDEMVGSVRSVKFKNTT